MSQTPVSLGGLTPAQKAHFQALTSCPKMSWPTFYLWLLVTGVYAGSDVLAFMGLLPLWAGMIVNSVIGYLAFSVVHDSIHRAISSSTRINDLIGQSAVFLGAPYVNLKLFRWAHILHHRFANGPRDPDGALHGAAWTLPLRWMLIDVIYLIYALRFGDKVSRPALQTSLRWALWTALLFGALTALGYGWHVVMLWFIPSRMIFMALGFSFFWLPHVPHDTRQEDNFTRATTVRLGHGWLMGPLLQCQNFHLIHHLYPMTPFYNNQAVWQLLESELRKKDLAIQHGFAIRPTIYPASVALRSAKVYA
ncbi:MAG: fatty acid desaturase [Stenotrophobium sp.]